MRIRSALWLASIVFVSTAAHAEMPADIVAGIRAMGAVNDARTTADVVRPMHVQTPPRDVTALRDIAFGDHPLQRLDVFTSDPDMGEGKPIVIFVHGGGFTGGDKHRPGDYSYDNVMIWAVSNGFVGVNTNYRLAPEYPYPNATEDVASAVRWAREHGAEFGGDPNKIFLWGHSAGASLVGSYIGHPEFHVADGSGLVGAILASGGGYEIAEANEYYNDPARLSEMASLPGLIESDVPLFVMRAELDPPNIAGASDRLNAALCAAGNCPEEFLLNPAHNHMSQVYTVNTTETEITDRIKTFIETNAEQ